MHITYLPPSFRPMPGFIIIPQAPDWMEGEMAEEHLAARRGRCVRERQAISGSNKRQQQERESNAHTHTHTVCLFFYYSLVGRLFSFLSFFSIKYKLCVDWLSSSKKLFFYFLFLVFVCVCVCMHINSSLPSLSPLFRHTHTYTHI